MIKYISIIFLLMIIPLSVFAHHYKGLAHYGYFENYPQIPTFEFIAETQQYVVFVNVYNFQELKLPGLVSSNDVRFYIYIYDLAKNSAYSTQADFALYSGKNLLFENKGILPEIENIYIIQEKLQTQGNLVLNIKLANGTTDSEQISIPVAIVETFFHKYLIYIGITLLVVIGIITKIFFVVKPVRS